MIKKVHYVVLTALLSLLISSTFAQTGMVKGTVTDLNGEMLIGANVYIEGMTTKGTITDVYGNYVLESVPVGQVKLISSFIGYLKDEKTVTVIDGKTVTVDFVLVEDIMQLDELVVIGYGTKRKRDITSSIVKVKADEMQNVSVPTFESALQGRTTGVQVTSDNGMAGGGVTIRVRGTSSLMASSQPLYVVDGVPIITGSYTTSNGYPDKSNALAQIDPSDIESIQVLKDASAAAIYGARSANGVVLITTKHGKQGKTKFNVGYYTGVSDVTKRLDILDGPDYLKYTKQAWTNSNKGTEQEYYENLPFNIYNPSITVNPDYSGDADGGIYRTNKDVIDNTNTDWIDLMLRKGSVQQANVSASGGDAKTTYYLGGAYRDEKGVIISNAFKRVNGRMNLEHKATEKFSFGSDIAVTYTKNNRVPTGWAGGLGTAQSRALPLMPVYNADGSFFGPRSGVNTIAEDENINYQANTMSLLGKIFAKYQITDDLTFNTDFGLNNLYLRENKYVGTITQEDAFSMDRRVEVSSYNTNTTLNYDKHFGDDHHLTAMAGMSVQKNNQYESEFNSSQFPSPTLQNPNSGVKKGGYDYESEYGFISYFNRESYSYKGRYLASFSIRYDGSSRFGIDNQYGWFPSGSVGWIISDEGFMQGISFLSILKLRGSYGLTGNAEIGNYRSFGTYYTTQYNGESGIGVGNIANPNLGWEKTAQTDIGIDYGFFDGRISGGFDYYYKSTTEMLLNVNVPQTSGSSSVIQNVGKMENKGVEFFIDARILTGDFTWTTNFNIGHNSNEIIDINGQILAGENFGNNFAVEGKPIGSWRLVEYAGVDEATGQPLFINQETGEATTEYNFDRDAIVTGNPYPDFYGGINNSFSFKNFDFSALFTFSSGQDVYRDDGKFFQGGNIGSNWNQMQLIENSWQNPGDITDEPQLLWDGTGSTYNTTHYLSEASYIRLKTISFGYNLPKSFARRLKIDNARIYINGQNLLTFTDYPGWDPEVNRDGSGNITQGVTYLSPPQIKMVTFGLTLDF